MLSGIPKLQCLILSRSLTRGLYHLLECILFFLHSSHQVVFTGFQLIGQVIQTIAAENATAEGPACGETLNSVQVYLEISNDEASHDVAPNFVNLAT